VAGVHSGLEHGRGKSLWNYWVHGPGRARWATWTQLHAELLKEGVPPEQADGLARNIYRQATGHEPPHPGRGGKRKGKR
jgi:hypothetical protein